MTAKLPGLVLAARQLGFRSLLISLALGRKLQDWEVSLRGAIAMEPDHISAYALVIKKARWGAGSRGELPMPTMRPRNIRIADHLLGGGYATV